MLKIKPIIFGMITAITVFALLLIAETFVVDKLEVMNETAASNFAYVFYILSVFTAAFVAALSARGRGVIYGAVIALICSGVFFAAGLIMGGENIGLMAARCSGSLPAGVVGGVCGILVSNKNEYI